MSQNTDLLKKYGSGHQFFGGHRQTALRNSQTMKILVLGNPQQHEAFQAKFTARHEVEYLHQLGPETDLSNTDLVVDFQIDDMNEQMEGYLPIEGLRVLVNAPKNSLAELAYFQDDLRCTLFGFNGLPTFLEREVFEVSCLHEGDGPILKEICEALGTDYEIVKDRVGMVTPRIIFMIINEAYYTLQEGTASKADIDRGMKLGTNYPYGPFEWCELIGVEHVYETLEALYLDTREERYKICPLLKQAYLHQP